MGQSMFEQILRCKYNITDTILVEGMFVSLVKNSKNAISLVSLAIGERCFFVAKVILSGDVPDYDLVSMIPLPLLSFAYLDSLKMLKVRCKVKDSQVYQLCTSYNREEIWDNIKDVIKYLGLNKESDVWVDQSLSATTSNSQKGIDPAACGDMYMIEISNAYSKYLRPKSNPKSFNNNKDISTSLPTLIPPNQNTKTAPTILNRRHSADYIDCFDFQFEHFVNDAPTRFSEYNGVFTSCSWNGSADDLAVVCTEKLNAGNTNSSAVTPANNKQTDRSGDFLGRLRMWLSCTKCKTEPKG